ncbi:MAG TPA: diguanylate cyclase [Macromonas sp.]|nr:diguanylate cyclase [Macromonas sp.]
MNDMTGLLMERPTALAHPSTERDEWLRLEALRRYDVLDTPPECAFDDLAMLASLVCEAPVAMVSLVDAERQWAKAVHGDAVRELPRAMSFCSHAIEQPEQVMVVSDATQDARFAHNAMVGGPYGVYFYAGAPLLTHDGFALGTLCVYDKRARGLSDPQRLGLEALARQVIDQLERHRLQALVDAHALSDGTPTLGNARSLERRLEEEWQRHARRGESLGLLMLDLHTSAADQADAVHALLAALRSSDYLCRLEDGTLAALLPHSGVNSSMHVAQRVRQALSKASDPPGAWTWRMGVAAMVPSRSTRPQQLLERARHALQRSGVQGRARIEAFSGW